MDGPVFLEIEAYEAKSQDISIVSTSHEKYTTVSLCLNMFWLPCAVCGTPNPTGSNLKNFSQIYKF